jgi:cytochrome c oxidase accessory protein FixG
MENDNTKNENKNDLEPLPSNYNTGQVENIKESSKKYGKSIDLNELTLDKPHDPFTMEAGNSFRDSVGNIDKKGNRIWIYPTKPKGDFTKARTIVSLVLLAILFINPFLSVDGHPLFLFDILNRTFILFGVLFYPQDFHLFAMSLMALIFFAVLFTAIFGRIWCGWACPQTIFMETVFRQIEYWIDGNASEQRMLDKKEMNGEKLMKRIAKYSIFYAISFIIANLLLAYVVGIDRLSVLITDGPFAHSSLFMSLIIFSLIFFGVFAWFREQACIYVCPYGRLQSVLLDSNTIVVAYDYKRGEPREKFKKKRSVEAGDCIDCNKCVQVCPTGIDIRNGTQLECVNCTACIDACDAIMTQIGKPTKLIKYASLDQIEKGEKFKFTPRLMFYSVVLLILLSSLVYLLSNRTDVEATILRAKGVLFNVEANGDINNLYTMKIFNKTYKDVKFDIKTVGIKSKFKLIGGKPQLINAGEMFEATFILSIPKSELHEDKNDIIIQILEGNEVIEETKTSFLSPKEEEDDSDKDNDKENKKKNKQENKDKE